MKALVCLEWIGEREESYAKFSERMLDNLSPEAGRTILGKAPSRKPWMAEILGLSEKYVFDRRFLKPQVQYQRASGTGNRGVELWFLVDVGSIYEVRYYASWKRQVRMFCVFDAAGEKTEVSPEWVKIQLG